MKYIVMNDELVEVIQVVKENSFCFLHYSSAHW